MLGSPADPAMGVQFSHHGAQRVNATHKLVWFIVMAIFAGILYFAFRGYLTPAMLIDFANSFVC